MKKTLIGIVAAMTLPAIAQGAGIQQVELEGFIDIVWAVSDGTDEGVNGSEGHFYTSGELDLKTKLNGPISMRLDADLNPADGDNDSGRLEQAFLTWAIDNNLSLKAGVFNNNLGFEKEDAPELYQVTHGQLWDIWNLSTFGLDGNNLQGIELSYKQADFTAFVGFLNDLGDVPEENSIKLGATVTAVKDVTITAGLITQDEGNPGTPSLENIIDINALWKFDGNLTLGGELMLPSEIIDSGLMLMANYQVNPKLSGTLRYDMVAYDGSGVDDTTSLTIAGLYSIEDNLFANAEIRINSDDNTPTASSFIDGVYGHSIGEGDGTTVHLELLATF